MPITVENKGFFVQGFFKRYTPSQIEESRAWARANFNVNDGPEGINNVWHPAVRAECLRMLLEQMEAIEEGLTI